MATDSEGSRRIDDPGSEILAALDRIERRLEMLEGRQRRIEEEILAAERRHTEHIGSFAPMSAEQHAAEEDWQRVVAAARQAMERERPLKGAD
jgi:F0F1-type ATP synthase membrane subunit b/b'